MIMKVNMSLFMSIVFSCNGQPALFAVDSWCSWELLSIPGQDILEYLSHPVWWQTSRDLYSLNLSADRNSYILSEDNMSTLPD